MPEIDQLGGNPQLPGIPGTSTKTVRKVSDSLKTILMPELPSEPIFLKVPAYLAFYIRRCFSLLMSFNPNRMRLVSVFIFPILLFIGPCDSAEPVSASPKCVKVSYVDGICLEAILRIEDESAARYGEQWGGEKGVFYGLFPCGTDWDLVTNGSFYVEILEAPEQPTCVRCMATINYTGSKVFPVKLTSGCAD